MYRPHLLFFSQTPLDQNMHLRQERLKASWPRCGPVAQGAFWRGRQIEKNECRNWFFFQEKRGKSIQTWKWSKWRLVVRCCGLGSDISCEKTVSIFEFQCFSWTCTISVFHSSRLHDGRRATLKPNQETSQNQLKRYLLWTVTKTKAEPRMHKRQRQHVSCV